MSADPRLLIPLDTLDGLDPVGLWVYGHRGGLTGLVLAATPLTYFPYDYQRPIVCDPTVCHLGLFDPATRDRCLRWLAGRVGLDACFGAPSWQFRLDRHARFVLRSGAGVRLFTDEIPDEVDPGDAAAHWIAVPSIRQAICADGGPSVVLSLGFAAVLRHVGGAR